MTNNSTATITDADADAPIMNETTPLLMMVTDDVAKQPSHDHDVHDNLPTSTRKDPSKDPSPPAPAPTAAAALPTHHYILLELVGAQYLLLTTNSSNNSSSSSGLVSSEPYAVVQWGLQKTSLLHHHRTKPLINKATTSFRDPIWSIREHNLVLVNLSVNSLCNNKHLVITIWGRRPRQRQRRPNIKSSNSTGASSVFLGKVRLGAKELVELATNHAEKRIVRPLLDDLGRPMMMMATTMTNCEDNNNNAAVQISSSDESPTSPSPQLALRVRVASTQDVRFVQAWNSAAATTTDIISSRNNSVIPRSILDGTGILQSSSSSPNKQQQHLLVTEQPESEVTGAQLRSTLSASFNNARTSNNSPSSSNNEPSRIIRRIKPCPDPCQQHAKSPVLGGETMSINKREFHQIVEQPSRQWIKAGSGELGQLYVEILSCHNLPNVDYGSTVGNVTDAFCAACYGDAMVQTSIIDDELSPHWPPWSQRAFCFRILHPSQVLYLGVFGFKRGSVVFVNHVPIGRVEINVTTQFQNGTVYDLYYPLSRSSHVTARTGQGTIRIRLRLEWNDPRAALVASLTQPHPPDLYINVQEKKSFAVARYTCRGEYDNEEKFSLSVLLSYVDEVKDGYLRRIVYAASDTMQTVLFWRSQQFQLFQGCCVLWFPFHSMLLFCFGVLLVERPSFIPALVCFGAAWILLANTQVRRQSPSPWHRGFSFGHYLQILLFGRASNEFENIKAGEGWDEQKSMQEALQKRIEDDSLFSQRKEAEEKEIEIVEQVEVATKSKAALVPIEILVVLGKVQGIVGQFCRLCRSVDAVITWETQLSFWVTIAFLLMGVVCLFVPWAFLLKWTGRFAVVVLLGPQNKLIDIFMTKHSTPDTKLRDLFAKRMFRARCRQEDVGKLKAFRRILFGKYATAVPPQNYTLHIDRPLPTSTAHVANDGKPEIPDDAPFVPGQKLYGHMIPRPYSEWRFNEEESKKARDCLVAAISKLDRTPTQRMDSSNVLDDSDIGEEEGVEVSDLYDIEGGVIRNDLQRQRQESLYGDWGVEVVDEYDNEAQFARKSWRESSKKVLNVDLVELSDSDDDDDEKEGDGESCRDGEGGEEGAENNSAVPLNPTLDSTRVSITRQNKIFNIVNGKDDKDGVAKEILESNADSTGDKMEQAGFVQREEMESDNLFEDKEAVIILAATRNEELSPSEGVEAVELFEYEAAFVRKSFRTTSVSPPTAGLSTDEGEMDIQASINEGDHQFIPYSDVKVNGATADDKAANQTLSVETMNNACDDDDDKEEKLDDKETARTWTMEAQLGASARELGMEIVEDFDEEEVDKKSYK